MPKMLSGNEENIQISFGNELQQHLKVIGENNWIMYSWIKKVIFYPPAPPQSRIFYELAKKREARKKAKKK